MKGFQNLNETEQRLCAELAHKAGLTINSAHHLWLLYGDALLMRLHSGVQIIIAYPED